MHAAVQSHPQRIGFGPGCAVAVADEFAARQVRRVLILTSPSVAPHAKPLVEALMARSIVVSAIPNVTAGPTVDQFEFLLGSVRHFCPEGIIGFGGGSVLDLAKLAASLHELPAPLPTFYGGDLLPRRKTLLACVPTTLGTGCELSPHSFLFSNTESREQTISSQWLVPDFVFVDPLYTLSLPPAAATASSIAAMGLCLEAASEDTSFLPPSPFADSGFQLIAQSLQATLDGGLTPQVRATMALGCLQAALAGGPKATLVLQALAAPLSRHLRLSRNLACALLVPSLARAGDASTQLSALDALMARSGLLLERDRLAVSDEKLAELEQTAFDDPRLHKDSPERFSLGGVRQLYQDALRSEKLCAAR